MLAASQAPGSVNDPVSSDKMIEGATRWPPWLSHMLRALSSVHMCVHVYMRSKKPAVRWFSQYSVYHESMRPEFGISNTDVKTRLTNPGSLELIDNKAKSTSIRFRERPFQKNKRAKKPPHTNVQPSHAHAMILIPA